MKSANALEPTDIKKYPPILRIDSDDLPIIAKSKIGDTYHLHVDAKLVSLSTAEEYGETEDASDKGKKKQKTMASLKVTSIEPMDSKMSMSKPNMMAEQMKKRM
jgi:hypothetical protein